MSKPDESILCDTYIFPLTEFESDMVIIDIVSEDSVVSVPRIGILNLAIVEMLPLACSWVGWSHS